MQCPGCGNGVHVAAAFCGKCGQRLTHDVATRVPRRRPAVVTMLAILQFAGASFWLLFGLAVLSAFREVPETARTSGMVIAALIGVGLFGMGIAQVVGGIGLLKLKRYGYALVRAFAMLWLLGFPVGTVVSIVVLIYLNNSGVKLLFSERPIDQLTVTEYSQLVASTQPSGATMVLIAVGALVMGILAFGMFAAIAIPGLLRARIASNEAAAIGLLRTFVAAERSYAAVNDGRFGSPECLRAPATCIDKYAGPPFLITPLQRTHQDRGYIFQFFSTETLGTPDALDEPRRIKSFALMAWPSTLGATGRRTLYIDASRRLVWAFVDRPPTMSRADCPADWLTVAD
jgi:MFS family permease